MGLEWLEQVVSILTEAGIQADEEYAVGAVPEITAPVAAVGLSGLDCGEGVASIMVRILSPRELGGWQCQTGAVAAVAALEAAGIRGVMGTMDYLSGCDCYSIPIQAKLEVKLSGDSWVQGSHWKVTVGTTAYQWVTEFVGEQDQGRRLIGATCQTDPVGVTPGYGGWNIRMVQEIPQNGSEEDEPEEPFDLMVTQGGQTHAYRDCCWNSVKREYTQAGMRVERQGLALRRGVTLIG